MCDTLDGFYFEKTGILISLSLGCIHDLCGLNVASEVVSVVGDSFPGCSNLHPKFSWARY